MTTPATTLREYFTAAAESLSPADRLQWYFDRFWLSVAADNGFVYPAQFPEGSDLAVAHNAAHAQLVQSIREISAN